MIEHVVNVSWDDEAQVWIAICETIPLAMESGSLDTLIERVKNAAPEILLENCADVSSVCLCFRPNINTVK